ncbi:factor H binding protein domain-containing protein [Gallibacterium anatis]|uniref:factor H binding protein domain-containing protein n=1 Tax=Gallibacterium anatis TaxID=750 RepID=UPI0039FB9236
MGEKNDLQKINYYQCDCFSFNRLWGGGGGSNNIDRSNVEPIIPNHPQDQTNNLSTSTDTTQKDELKKTQDRLTETSSSLKKAQEELKRKTAEFKALKDAQATTEKQLTDASNSLKQIQSDLKEKERVFEELQRQNQLKLQELSETHQKLTEREQLIEIIKQKMSDTVESMGATLDNPWLMEKTINHDQLSQNQLYTQPVMALYPLGEDSEGMLVGDRYLYKQQYSVVYARNWLASLPDGVLSKGGRFSVNGIGNLLSEDEPTILPSEGSATYRGKAFNANNMGDLTYRVDFEQRTGQGEITNFSNNIGHITLHQGSINDQEIKADASMAGGITGKYTLGFFGPNGEEIAGDLYIDSSLDNSIPANGGTRKKYEAKNRGVAFGLAAQKESQQ